MAPNPPASADPRIDVVVPVYNKLLLLDVAVGSILDAAEAYGAASVWVVDNGSTDGSYEFLRDRFAARAHLLRLSSGTISAVRNLGARQGSAPILSFIDCDCLVPRGYFGQLQATLGSGRMDATGCKVVLPPSPTWIEATWNRMHDEGSEGEREWINSGNFAVRRQTFQSVGGFSERLETGEDAELCQRIRRAGGVIISDGRLAVAHLDNAKTLGTFLKKEWWRGLGMFGTASRRSLDKPLLMTGIHLAALLLAACILLFGDSLAAWRLLAATSCCIAVPLIAVVYRSRRTTRRFSVAEGLLLYELYFLARIAAMASVAARRIRGRA